jgi:hypothetical protein
VNPLTLPQRGETVATPAPADGLESMLNAMGRFGEPKLSRIGGEWYCRIEMNTVVPGARFDVASGFHHPTASSAAKECLERAEAAMRAVGGAK